MHNLETFIIEAHEKHGNTYSYENFEYKNCNTNSLVTCKIHGDWSVSPNNHVRNGSGCPQCANKNRWANRKDRITTETLIEKIKEIFSDSYSFEKTTYTTPWEKFTITCNKHGDFQSNFMITKGVGCPKCGRENAVLTRIENGQVVPRDQLDAKTLYYTKVKNATERAYRNFKHIINPEDLPRNYFDYQVDHIFSQQQGFLENIDPEIIGHYSNLRMITASENKSKNFRSDVSKEELIRKFEEAIKCTST